METETFSSRLVGTTGHEILTPDGQVIAWTVDSVWAAVIVALPNGAEEISLTAACTAPART